MNEIGHIAWEILFSEKIDIPDPNKPENLPRLNAQQKNKIKALKDFYNGPGKAFLDMTQAEIREKIYNLLIKEHDCKCPASNELREISFLFKQLTKAAMIKGAKKGQK